MNAIGLWAAESYHLSAVITVAVKIALPVFQPKLFHLLLLI